MIAVASGEETVMTPESVHEPVLLRETIDWLAVRAGSTVVDATLGPGGHAHALLERIGPSGRLIGIDRDPQALVVATGRLARFGPAFTAVRGNHTDLLRLLRAAAVERVDAVLLDLGLSSLQLASPERGFSFREDGPLDMRMDPQSAPTAAELLAGAGEDELRRLLWRYGEERRARAIARAIVAERVRRPLETTRQLAELVARVLGPAARRYRIHPATRTFQALRIAVNREVDDLERLVADATSVLRCGGRLAVISYHSLEDRAVKHSLR
ncbi:MAG TPA: 16S rRNA (cytosine(1402)-N(4))-methyltransferase RsmH, partial [Candidatus Polarisedimenticolaceae bacterium]|nr:16S rRNA (cytosine(1402)-N(4))-methyltransferase RsmH [Candidatus Polarisedimenticolaceae bacterium]